MTQLDINISAPSTSNVRSRSFSHTHFLAKNKTLDSRYTSYKRIISTYLKISFHRLCHTSTIKPLRTGKVKITTCISISSQSSLGVTKQITLCKIQPFRVRCTVYISQKHCTNAIMRNPDNLSHPVSHRNSENMKINTYHAGESESPSRIYIFSRTCSRLSPTTLYEFRANCLVRRIWQHCCIVLSRGKVYPCRYLNTVAYLNVRHDVRFSVLWLFFPKFSVPQFTWCGFVYVLQSI